ncbi:hypothetical protein HY480_03280 [Candidatus Uhrbacteria bacterium]|nr:hypothetical protein [Candidatus Uhrbacteria bacterium]
MAASGSIIDRIIAINGEESDRYVAADSARRRHWAKHPTGFAALKCMDGRVHVPTMTQTAIGLVKPFRAIGGRFELWWPAFAKRMWNWVKAVRDRGDRCVVLVTYHYSASNPHLGCAGWNHDTAAARAHAERLAAGFDRVFGEQVTAMVTGVETDRDILTLHGTHGDVSGAHLIGKSDGAAQAELAAAFPRMDDRALADCMPFLIGNAAHVAAVTEHPRKVSALDHDERVIAIGHGFDYWVAHRNVAVIVNDVDPNLDVPIETAARILERNLVTAVADDDVLLLASVPYSTHGIERALAIERARGLNGFAQLVIRNRNPKLVDTGRLHALVGITFERTKRLEVIESSVVR